MACYFIAGPCRVVYSQDSGDDITGEGDVSIEFPRPEDVVDDFGVVVGAVHRSANIRVRLNLSNLTGTVPTPQFYQVVGALGVHPPIGCLRITRPDGEEIRFLGWQFLLTEPPEIIRVVADLFRIKMLLIGVPAMEGQTKTGEEPLTLDALRELLGGGTDGAASFTSEGGFFRRESEN